MKLIKNQYEEGYHDNFLYREIENSQRNRERLKLLLAQKETGLLLEIGCGKAGFLRLAEDHFEVEGMDISTSAIKAIRGHFGERVSVSNLEQDPLPSARYDVVVVFNILEHLNRPGEALRKIAGALKNGGVMIGSVPHNAGPVGRLVTRIGNFFDRTHVATYPPRIWLEQFEQAGFAQNSFFGEITLGRNRCRYLRSPLWPYLAFNLMFVCAKLPAK